MKMKLCIEFTVITLLIASSECDDHVTTRKPAKGLKPQTTVSSHTSLPGVKVEPKISAITIGNVVNLNCDGLASAFGGTPVQWLKNGVPVAQTQQLQIGNLAGDVAAEYTCQIKPIGSNDWIKSLPIVPKTGKQGAATAPVVQPSSSVLVPGEPATLECTPPLGAQPGANAYEWYKNGKKLEGSGSKITFNADVTSGGDYSCGYHLPGTSSLISSVPVPLKTLVDPTVQIATNEGIPIIDPSSVPSGVPVTLKCDTGGAAGVVQWLKDGIQIGDGQVITISGGASAKGNYACNFTPRGVNKRLKSKDIKLNPKDTPANTDRPSTPAGQKNGGSTKPPGLSGLWQKLFPG